MALVTTTKGEMDDSLLEKKEGHVDNDNGAVCVLDFGADKTSIVSFTVQMPENTASSALIRIV